MFKLLVNYISIVLVSLALGAVLDHNIYSKYVGVPEIVCQYSKYATKDFMTETNSAGKMIIYCRSNENSFQKVYNNLTKKDLILIKHLEN